MKVMCDRLYIAPVRRSHGGGETDASNTVKILYKL
ncbi:uncharacterized protein LOC111831560 [Capsella rubella]|nr:uncharacterized protein LOC111831560 [Capsella rubella]